MRAMSGPSHVGDVFILVADFLEREAHHFEPHLAHVLRTGGTHAAADHFRLFHDLFHRELADDAAQVTFHHQANKPFPLFGPLGEELFGSGSNRNGIGFHFELRHRFDGHAQRPDSYTSSVAVPRRTTSVPATALGRCSTIGKTTVPPPLMMRVPRNP